MIEKVQLFKVTRMQFVHCQNWYNTPQIQVDKDWVESSEFFFFFFVCVCVWGRGRGRQTDRQTEQRETDRLRGRGRGRKTDRQTE